VSVVIPVYQGESRIGRTLARLGDQTFTDFEVVTVNDGSTDGTSEIVRRAITADARIRLVEQPNAGIAAARNRGLEAAQGSVIAFLDDDDLWHREKLARQVARLDATPHAAVVSCYSALVDSDGRLLGWRLGGTPEGNVYREMLEWDMVSGGSVALVTRAAIEAAGGFDVSLPDRADWDLWIRLARQNAFTCVPLTLVGYTRRAGSVSQSYDRMIAHGQRVLEKARREDAAITEAEHRAFLARDTFGAACLCLADERRDLAWRYVAAAVRDSPAMILARQRRLGILAMLAASSALPAPVYRNVLLTAMARTAFGLRAGSSFDCHSERSADSRAGEESRSSR
jgi:GT2 family glycosyltransferase